MNDLLDGIDDPVTEAARMLAQHDLFVVPGPRLDQSPMPARAFCVSLDQLRAPPEHRP